jgi:uncharacterized protein YbjQ (UPF0145 family)
MVAPEMITSGLELPGYRLVENKGIVRGIVVRSRSVVGSFFGSLQSMLGGNITIYSEMCEHARRDAFELMLDEAKGHRANAVIGFRYDATELGEGMTEVLAYGTACVVEKI